ncbi:MAG: hypothetical protein M5U34_37885 [Chloroflexi bacterium]|nr:hypothetical protein [Chloroflexota bacterium]
MMGGGHRPLEYRSLLTHTPAMSLPACVAAVGTERRERWREMNFHLLTLGLSLR